jgi:1,4-alpha-glucan branching enzyme
MGGEFAQWHEWNHDTGLDWPCLENPAHAGVQSLVRDLNGLYRDAPALHQGDCQPEGFRWVVVDDGHNSVFAWLRYPMDGGPPALVVCNFTPVPRHGYRLGVPLGGAWQERLNTDAAAYGGSNLGNDGLVHAAPDGLHGLPASLTLTLPPLATLVLMPGHP